MSGPPHETFVGQLISSPVGSWITVDLALRGDGDHLVGEDERHPQVPVRVEAAAVRRPEPRALGGRRAGKRGFAEHGAVGLGRPEQAVRADEESDDVPAHRLADVEVRLVGVEGQAVREGEARRHHLGAGARLVGGPDAAVPTDDHVLGAPEADADLPEALDRDRFEHRCAMWGGNDRVGRYASEKRRRLRTRSPSAPFPMISWVTPGGSLPLTAFAASPRASTLLTKSSAAGFAIPLTSDRAGPRVAGRARLRALAFFARFFMAVCYTGWF